MSTCSSSSILSAMDAAAIRTTSGRRCGRRRRWRTWSRRATCRSGRSRSTRTSWRSPPGRSGSRARRALILGRPGAPAQPSEMVVMLDPPRHGPLRRVGDVTVHPSGHPVTPRRDRPNRRARSSTTWRPPNDAGEFDFVERVAAPLPLGVIAWILGVPRDDWKLLFRWTNEVIGKDDPEYRQPRRDAGPDHHAALAVRCTVFWRSDRRASPRAPRRPGERAARSEIEGSPLSEEQLVSYCELLVEAGNETTRNAISGGLLAFDEHPAEWEKLRRGAGVAAGRGRGDPPLGHAHQSTSPARPPRTSSCGASRSQRGTRLRCSSRRRTVTRRCSTIPSTFRVDRRPNPHLAFGFGAHFCMGAHVARVELETIFRHLLDTPGVV